ncbi:MAG: gliding motility-associated C-terminal domain-containing protein [Bacteroidales bacterium]|nr:gliding motility-associated C-terminal domain-containing protein [Bacteroidales bacterium]
MKCGKALSIIALTLCLTLGLPGRAQTVYMQNHDTVFVYNCRQHSGNIYTPTILEDTNDCWVIIYGNGEPISISFQNINTTTQTTNDCWVELAGQDTTITYHSYELTHIPLSLQGDSLVIHFHWEPYIFVQFNIFWYCSPVNLCSNAPSVQVNNITTTTADVQWSGSYHMAIIDCGPFHLVTSDPIVHLTGLQPGTQHRVGVRLLADSNYSCCATTVDFVTDVSPCIGEPDMQDLDSYYCKCYFGSFSNPYLTLGKVDHGPQSEQSRHTIHTDPTETDPHTGGLLHTVCPGTSCSVRLGNWKNGGQAESISYKLHVDTLIYSLLILRYAVVLQNPNHSPSQQPRFRLEILDTDLSVIDSTCGTADFVANASLGWNTNSSNGIIWKDWTTVGFDLSPYHDQTIILRFTTFDCGQLAHYGYAYYNAECIPRSVASESCGPVDSNSVTAPDGFLYSWYTTSLDSVISSQQNYTFLSTDAYVYCRLTSTENHQCYVTMSAYTGNRWPHAVADTISAVNTCQGYTVTFVDRSTVVNSLGHTTGERSESRRWYFDDGDSSTLISPQHTFLDTGLHQVTLVSGLAHDLCTDTTVFTVYAPERVFYSEKPPVTACDSLLFTDGRWYSRDTTLYNRRHVGTCDSIDIFHLSIHPSFLTEQPADTFCHFDTYTWRGQTVGQIGTESTLVLPLADSLLSVHNCDSVYTITLVQLGRPSLGITWQSDCLHKAYHLTAHSSLPYIYWESDPDDSLLDGHRSDTSIYVIPYNTSRYYLTTDYRPTPLCPTRDTITLQPVTFPEARLFVQPETVNADHPVLVASDLSRETSGRSWQMLYYPDGTDTLFLPDTTGTIRHTLGNLSLDSLQVILSVSNSICYDTARRVVPVIGTLFWAPNVFTPGEDFNNRFLIVGHGLLQAELSIYNREGLLVYRTTDLDAGWDGTHEGRPCPQAAYVWHLRYRSATYPDTWQSSTGTVTLLR